SLRQTLQFFEQQNSNILRSTKTDVFFGSISQPAKAELSHRFSYMNFIDKDFYRFNDVIAIKNLHWNAFLAIKLKWQSTLTPFLLKHHGRRRLINFNENHDDRHLQNNDDSIELSPAFKEIRNWKVPHVKYFEVTSYPNWSIPHYDNWLEHNNHKKIAHTTFYKVLRVISSDEESPNELREIARRLLEKKYIWNGAFLPGSCALVDYAPRRDIPQVTELG
ncbi:33005_t:CDS:2, partial [Racocetra persica]